MATFLSTSPKIDSFDFSHPTSFCMLHSFSSVQSIPTTKSFAEIPLHSVTSSSLHVFVITIRGGTHNASQEICTKHSENMREKKRTLRITEKLMKSQ